MVNIKKNNSLESNEEFSLKEEALIRQWLEYKKVVLDRLNLQSTPHAVFQEINSELMNVSYLAGTKFSKADLEIFSGLTDIYASQSIQSKEKYPYLSRWFRHIQHLTKDQLQITVPFSRSSLY